MQFPLLSIIIFTPLVTGLIILMIPARYKTAVKVVALAASSINLLLSIWVFITYNFVKGGYQFIEQMQWLPSLGISYHLGVDGIITDRVDLFTPATP